MNRYSLPALMTGTVFTTFWAYTIILRLLKELTQNVAFIDLGVFFILGLVSGLSLGLVLTLRRKKSAPAAALETMAVFALYWAYTMANTLISELGKKVTMMDLGSLYILGFFAGLFIGLIVVLQKITIAGSR